MVDLSLRSLIAEGLRTVYHNADWMGWNLFLAIVPLVLSVFLFRRLQFGNSTLTLPSIEHRHRSPLWWFGVAVFVAFLPNAPYILTDIIHFVRWVREGASAWTVALVYVPLFFLFLFAGFEAYVMSLLNVRYYLKQRGLRYIFASELTFHGLSAIGIYLGRFLRFNSWNLLTHWNDVAGSVFDALLGKDPLMTIALTFIILTVLYALLKPVHLALSNYWKFRPKRNQQNFVIPNS
ncbi:MAG: DUF1361 domain-containing protein [Plectolyngbya sp. WJT66-NPBG17]|jgi:uncharacterized membrane protein|nr:DUF1361 domain-containing protein [Plectolyngbya sp. WJT66-NPBG17]MBW4526787.1 DUF1361 domain-containing protein [Phormidium tanganyikae FI6-MK23]